MTKDRPSASNELDDQKARARARDQGERESEQAEGGEQSSSLAALQQTVGNRAVQRLLAQRSGGADGPFELDDATAERINHERGGGQALDSAAQERMSGATGYSFDGVRVHTNPEADALNREIGAKAFTTGQDIYFRQGAYDPGSTGGQELLAHELTHVAQQGSGGGGGGPMTVNAPGDAFEQEADGVAKAVSSPTTAGAENAGVQRQEEDEDEEMLQRQEADEDEDLLKQ